MSGPRVVLDLRAAQSRTFGERGIARWSTAFAAALVRTGAPVEAVLLDPSAPTPTLPAELSVPGLVRPNTAVEARLWGGPDAAYHVLSPFERGRPVGSALPGHALEAAGSTVATFYDAIPFALAGWYLADDATRRFVEGRRRILDRADLLLAISDHARTDGIDLLGLDPDRLVTIGSAASEFFSPGDVCQAQAVVRAALPAVTGPYVLTVAGWQPHKNPLALIDGWGRVPASTRAGRQLVLTCAVPAEAHGLVAARVAQAGLAPHEVVLTGRVDDELLRALYRGTELFVFASLYEGFGLPVLEAARCGVPAVTSSTTATPEVLDHPAGTFEPTDVEAMADVIHRGLVDAEFRAGLVAASQRAAATLTWDAVAGRAAAAYARLDGPSPRRSAALARRRVAPPRVALVGPLPPAPSGVATYTARVAEPLGRLVRLDCFAELAPWHGAERSYRHLPVAALDATLAVAGYDVAVHVIGNGDQHVRTAQLALRHPGVLWLHDDQLGALASLLGRGDDPDAGAALTTELLGASRAVVVHTEALASRLRTELAPDGPAVHVVPLPFPTRADLGLAPVADRHRGGGGPLLACFGIVDPAKQPDVVLDAAARLLPDHPGLEVAFVGPADEPHRGAVLARAEALGLADRVTLTGHVTARDYAAWLGRATVAVQLRAAGRGEASGTLADCVGAGLPVVTSVAAAGELPPGVATVLPGGSEAPAVAAALAPLLADGPEATAMRQAQAAAAAAWGPGMVAAAVAAVVDSSRHG